MKCVQQELKIPKICDSQNHVSLKTITTGFVTLPPLSNHRVVFLLCAIPYHLSRVSEGKHGLKTHMGQVS